MKPKIKLVNDKQTPWVIPSDYHELEKQAAQAEIVLNREIAQKSSKLATLSPTTVKAADLEVMSSYVASHYQTPKDFVQVILGSILKAAIVERKLAFCLSSISLVEIINADADLPPTYLKDFKLLSTNEKNVLKRRVWATIISAAENSGLFTRLGTPAIGCATPFQISKYEIAVRMAQAFRWSGMDVLTEQSDAAIKFSLGEGKRKSTAED